VRPGGIMFVNSDLISQMPSRSDIRIVQVPAITLAHDMGNDRVLNMVMLGAVNAVTGMVSAAALDRAVEKVLEGKKQALIDINQKALAGGAHFISQES